MKEIEIKVKKQLQRDKKKIRREPRHNDKVTVMYHLHYIYTKNDLKKGVFIYKAHIKVTLFHYFYFDLRKNCEVGQFFSEVETMT